MSQLVSDKLSVIIGTIACLLLVNLNKRKKYERLAISMISIITWDQYCRLSLAWISEKTGFLMIEIIAMIAFYDDKFGKIFDYPYQQSPIFLYKKFQKLRLNLRKLFQKLWTTEF